MHIIAHRGYWTHPSEKNSQAAFVRALNAGFGIETDLRDCLGAVVISHDMPHGGEMTLEAFLALCAKTPHGPLALNIKADGLQAQVRLALDQHDKLNAYVFDMTVPDMLGYFKRGIATYTRCSELEPEPVCMAQAAGVWLDAFHHDWYDMAFVARLLGQGQSVCVVSPELHGRPHVLLWHRLHEARLHLHPGLSLCTDYPQDAKEVFHGPH